MSDRITWKNETRKLGELIPWEHNPRQINKKEAERLGDSLDKFGQIQAIAIGPNNEIYDGHQRNVVWQILPQYGRNYEVDVRVSSRELTERERQQLVVYLHKGATGDWDWDELANSFEVPDLLEWGFRESELQLDWGSDDEWADALGDLPDGDRAPFQQMTFTLHDTQAEQIKAALSAAKAQGKFDTENENSNGNALARICETFLTDYGQS